jgi:hypothetical protein
VEQDREPSLPGNLVDGEKWWADYHDLKAQLKEQVRD